jgi:glycosyltransferase involved in cell wall biosynthesis
LNIDYFEAAIKNNCQEKNTPQSAMKEIKKIALFGLGGINWIGGVQYISNIIRALDSIHDEHPVEVHLIKNKEQEFADLKKIINTRIVMHDADTMFPPWSLYNRGIWFFQRKFMNRVIPRMENFFMKNGFDFVFPLAADDCKGKFNAASWIADFQYHHYPDGASKDFTAAAFNEISFIANNSKKIVLSSRACETDCNQIFPGTTGKTHAMPFAVYLDEQLLQFNDFDAITNKYKIPRNFIVVANSFCPTKNHKTLFEALHILNGQGMRVDLVCTGNIVDQRNLHFGNEILQMLTKYEVRDQVHLLGIIPRAEQVAVYRMAKAMVQPSLNEGWSTPVEEAKNLGKNLLVSDIDVHKEQCPGNEYIFRSLDAEHLAGMIQKIWQNNSDTCFPEIEREKIAFQTYRQHVKAFGRRFLEIAAVS